MQEIMNIQSMAELKGLVNKIEALESEANEIKERIKETYDDAKGAGYDPKIIRKLVALRAKDKDALQSEQNILGLYLHATDTDIEMPVY